jgi:hypothetical protein
MLLQKQIEKKFERDIAAQDFTAFESFKGNKVDDSINTLNDAKGILTGIIARFLVDLVIILLKKIKTKIEEVQLKKKKNADPPTPTID